MSLLCEPYLLDPGPGSVHVVWHTEGPGRRQTVLLGPAAAEMTEREAVQAATGPAESGVGWRRVDAVTAALTRLREDADSSVAGRSYRSVTRRPVHRQLATVGGLAAGRTPYRIVSLDGEASATVTATYSLAPAVPAGRPVRLLLTSDHQLHPMTPANLAKVAEVIGTDLDGVLMAGDMVNVADRASDWFDSATGLAFFASLTGRADHAIAGWTYRGAPILQHSPLFPALGNHEVMGRRSDSASLRHQFNDPQPDDWDVTTYRELFPVPASVEGGQRWWSRTIGDVHVIALFATLVWRPPGSHGRTKYQEADEDLGDPQRWGRGQFIFEAVGRGSAQFRWLERELTSAAARNARYRVLMFHHPGHGLGDHTVPPFADPVPTVTRDPASGAVTGVTYDYPLAGDHILRDLQPLFDATGVHLVLNGHSHLWNRFRTFAGVNWLETSNVGNSYGAYDRTSGSYRDVPRGYVRQGDPGGLAPLTPTVAPLTDDAGNHLPYLASNDITAFSILDSGAGVVRSYRFDTRDPHAPTVLFDEFRLR